MNLRLRWTTQTSLILWWAWVACAAAGTFQLFVWHFDIFNVAGPRYHTAILIAVPVLLALIALYCVARRRFLIYELPAFVLLPIVLCAVYEPLATLVSLLLLSAAYVTGNWLAEKLSIEFAGAAESLSLSSAVGFALLIALLFPLGLLRAYYWPVFLALLVVPVVLLHARLGPLVQIARRWNKTWRTSHDLHGPFAGVLVSFTFVFLLLTIAAAISPVTHGDAIRFHLPLVRAYADAHALEPQRFISYGYYPQAIETLMTLAYSLGGQMAAQMVNSIFFGLTLVMLFALARRLRLTPLQSIAAVVFSATIPVLHWTGSELKNDLGLALFQLAALYCFFGWQRSGNFRWIQLGTFLLAASFGVKHTAIFGAIPIALLYLYAVLKQPRAILAGLSITFVFLLFGTAWLARTWILTGNPVFPQGAAITTATAFRRASLIGQIERYLSVPFMLHFKGKNYFESPSQNPLGIFLLVFLPLGALIRRMGQTPEFRTLWLFITLYVAYWISIVGTLRYALVPLLLLTLFISMRIAAFQEHAPKSISLASIACLTFAMLVTIVMELAPHQPEFLLHRIDGNTYLRHALPPFGAVEFLQKKATRDDYILSIGDWAAAYSPNPSRFQHVYNNERTYSVLDLENQLPLAPWRYLILPNSANRKELESFVSRTRLLTQEYSDANFSVYELAEKVASPAAGR